LLADATLALTDIDAKRLGFAQQSAERMVQAGKCPAKVEALAGADAVLCTILVGDAEVWGHDTEFALKYGVDVNIGDTRDPSGSSRALRAIPVMLDIIKDVERLCPDAIFLNYANPMAMLCRALQRESFVRVSGLCRSVQGTAMMLARWIGAPFKEITDTCAGINHQAWYLKFEWNGEDAYPLIREAVKRPEIYNEEIVRNKMFLHLGYYVTESSGHNSEYNWWFRKRPDLIEKYCTHGTGWNPGVHAFILNEYREKEHTWKNEVKEWLSEETPVSLERGPEYAAPIINVWRGGEIYHCNGNVANTGLIPNLPEGACAKVPLFVDKAGFHPVHVGPLPPQCAIVINVNLMIE